MFTAKAIREASGICLTKQQILVTIDMTYTGITRFGLQIQITHLFVDHWIFLHAFY